MLGIRHFAYSPWICSLISSGTLLIMQVFSSCCFRVAFASKPRF